jgi:protein involved in polysaccharide export with SLBB domain
MKLKIIPFTRLGRLLLLPMLALALGGCSIFSGSDKNTNVMSAPGDQNYPGQDKVPRLHIGDSVTITFSGLPDAVEAQEKPIKEDGSITLPDIGRIKAAGKTIGELEDAIHDLYVPKIYTHLNVTVKTSNDRVYYVRGEVKSPGRMIYTGPITVSKAITSAGDFTDFANHGKIWLTRASGERFKLDLDRILAGEDPDPPVFPGDQIEVARRIF